MANGFLKDIQIIKWCSCCGQEWHPARYSWQDRKCIGTDCASDEIVEETKSKCLRRERPQGWKHGRVEVQQTGLEATLIRPLCPPLGIPTNGFEASGSELKCYKCYTFQNQKIAAW